MRAAAEWSRFPHHLRVLISIGCLLWIVFFALSLLSGWFDHGVPLAVRPVRLFLGLVIGAFVLHLIALRSAVALSADPRATFWILLFAVGYRCVLLPSIPIQEIDIYRYMWDGAVVASGGNPYQFSPRDVREAPAEVVDERLQSLVSLRDVSPSARRSLERIHYAHLTTIYPPVSQVVFAVSAWLTPDQASVRTRMILTKLLIVLFDFLAVLGLLNLLRLFGRAEGWVLCYAWSPLVLKEFANSGHLDAIAVGLTTWATFFWLRALHTQSMRLLLLSAAILGLGIGAKLYPLVIVPVVAVSVWRYFQWRGVLTSGLVLCAVTVCSLAPMLLARPQTPEVATASAAPQLRSEAPPPPDVVGADRDPAKQWLPPSTDVPPSHVSPPGASRSSRRRTGAGLNKFLSSWKMNDFFFLILQENLSTDTKAWFSVVPDSWKRAVINPVRTQTGQSESDASFLVARTLTAGVHLLIALALAWSARTASLDNLPRLAFLCLAWFWLLLPTLNPWYWIWAMPLLPFARLRSWLLLSGCVLIYYLRFYLQNTLGRQDILQSGYTGADFFHYVVVWVEYGPWLLLLTGEWWLRRRSDRQRFVRRRNDRDDDRLSTDQGDEDPPVSDVTSKEAR